MSKRNWKVFTDRRGRAETAAVITITRQGHIGLNKAARALLGETDGVILYHDHGEPAIGIRRAKRGEPNAYAYRRQGVISARKYCAHYGIDHSRLKRYEAYMEDGMLVVPLNDDRPTATSTEGGE